MAYAETQTMEARPAQRPTRGTRSPHRAAAQHNLGLLRVIRDGEVVRVLRDVLQQAAEGGRAAVLVYLQMGLRGGQRIAVDEYRVLPQASGSLNYSM